MDSIKVLPFKFKYYPLLQDISNTPYKNLPKLGFIAIRNKKIIAAAFLCKVEGEKGYLDVVIYNRYIGSKVADQGLKSVLGMIFNEAKDLKLKEIIVPDQYDELLKRLELTNVLLSTGVSYTYALGF